MERYAPLISFAHFRSLSLSLSTLWYMYNSALVKASYQGSRLWQEGSWQNRTSSHRNLEHIVTSCQDLTKPLILRYVHLAVR